MQQSFIQALFYWSQIYLCPHFIFGLKILINVCFIRVFEFLCYLITARFNQCGTSSHSLLSLNLQIFKSLHKDKSIKIFVKYFIKP